MSGLLFLVAIGNLCSGLPPFSAARCQKFYVECVRKDPRTLDDSQKLEECILKRLPSFECKGDVTVKPPL